MEDNLPFDLKAQLLNKKKCSLCHYTQSVLSLGACWFILVRIQFIRKTLSWGKIITYTFASSILGLFGFHRAYNANKITNNQIYYRKYIQNKKETLNKDNFIK